MPADLQPSADRDQPVEGCGLWVGTGLVSGPCELDADHDDVHVPPAPQLNYRPPSRS